MCKWIKIDSRYNHFIARVMDTRNGNVEVISRYYDGTQAQAIAHFQRLPELLSYRRAGYVISVQANSSILYDGWGE